MPLNDRPQRKAARKSREKLVEYPNTFHCRLTNTRVMSRTSSLFPKVRFRRPKPNAINVLPEELFVFIFQTVCGPENMTLSDPFTSALVLTSVCRVWRNIALRVPKLWTYIHLELKWDRETMTEFWMTIRPRAGLVPVVLILHDDEDRGFEDVEIVECMNEWLKDDKLSIKLVSILVCKTAENPLSLPLYLSAFTRPVDSVRIHSPPKQISFLNRDIWGLPQLRGSHHEVDLIEVINHLPRTQEFTIADIRLVADVALDLQAPLEDLEVLSIRTTVFDNPFSFMFEPPMQIPLRSVLSRCHKLNALELEGYILPREEDIQVRLETLKILQVADIDMLREITGLEQPITLPNLETLTLYNPGHGPDMLEAYLEANPSIICLDTPWFTDIDTVSRHLPLLQEWDIEDPTGLDMLYSSKDDGKTWRLPNLRSLSLFFADVAVQLDELEQLIYTRMWRRDVPESVITLEDLTVRVARVHNPMIDLERLFKLDIHDFAEEKTTNPTFIEFVWTSDR